jgi:type IV pilus assembly protein PilP
MSKSIKYLVLAIGVISLLSGCSNDMSELENTIRNIKQSSPGGIDPIPEVKIYEKYTYQSGLLRSPFTPDEEASETESVGDGPRPNQNRNKEFLEQFPLDSLEMVGTFNSKGIEYALIKTSDGLLHQIRAGEYMGQNDGEVLNVHESGVVIRELVPDGLGGYVYRKNEIPLNEVT